MIDTIRHDSLVPGPHLLFLGGVHGDEQAGTAALETLKDEFRAGGIRLSRGSVTIASRVNAGAAKRGVHCLDEDLNRIVRAHAAPRTHEQALANELVVLIDAADAVLDLHCTTAPSPPFIFLDDESAPNRAWADALGAPRLLAGWSALYAGTGTATTTEYAQARGKRALTVEVGHAGDAGAARYGRDYAARTLAHFGLTAAVRPVAKPVLLRLSSVVRREGPGSFARDWKSFQTVRGGELLARYDSGAEVRADRDAVVVMPYAQAGVGEEWLYLANQAQINA